MVLGVQEERREEGRKGEGEMGKEGERADTGFLTFWMVKGRPASGVDRRSAGSLVLMTVKVLVKTSLQKRYVCQLCKGLFK